MCRSCNSRSQTIQDVENNRHRVKYQNDQSSTEQTHPQRRPHTQLLHEARDQRGTHQEGSLSESRNSRRLLLHPAAIMKHIQPTCNSDSDACNFSNERDKKFVTKVNHVFKVNPNEFIEVRRNGETVRKLTNFTISWLLYLHRSSCQKLNVHTGNVKKSEMENLRWIEN